MAMKGILLGIENPLLDISAEADTSFLAKYDLQANNAILAEAKHLPIYQELASRKDAQFTAGGSCQNAIRTAQWMIGKSSPATVYLGCVGNDEFGSQLRDAALQGGVQIEYLVDAVAPTGTCAVVITGKNRSLVANLGAANCYKIEHLRQPDVWSCIERAKFYYSTGFFLTVSPESLLLIADHALQQNKIFALNFAAPFISKFFKDPLLKVLPYVDFLFGNESEAQAFAEEQGFEQPTDMILVAKWLASLPKLNEKTKRVVVITQGAQSTILVDGNQTLHKFPVIPITADRIIDTNGAGDAFVGGFLSQLIQDKALKTCVEGGHYAANAVIQRSGCTFPDHSTFSGC